MLIVLLFFLLVLSSELIFRICVCMLLMLVWVCFGWVLVVIDRLLVLFRVFCYLVCWVVWLLSSIFRWVVFLLL